MPSRPEEKNELEAVVEEGGEAPVAARDEDHEEARQEGGAGEMDALG